MEPSGAPALCAMAAALTAFLVVPSTAPLPVPPVRAEPVVVPAPDPSRVVFRTFRLRPQDPVTAVFEDGTTLLHDALGTLAGPLSPELHEKLVAVREHSASFAYPANHTGCLAFGGLELVGHGKASGDEPRMAADALMDAVFAEHRRRVTLARSPLVVAATIVADPPGSVHLRVDEVLRVDDGVPAPAPGVTLILPSRLVDVPFSSSWDEVPASGVWTVVLRRQEGAQWWPQPDLEVEQTRRDVAWLAAQPPPAARAELARRALANALEPHIRHR